VYFYIGAQDAPALIQEAKQFAQELSRRHAVYVYHEYPGKHSWLLWRAHVPELLEFMSSHLHD
jgi:enterochelin esterase-like enzyme